MSANALVPVPVLAPLLGAGVKLAVGTRLPRGQRALSVGVLTGMLGVAVTLLLAADRDGPQTADIAGWAGPTGIVLVADRLSALLLVVSCAVTLGVLVYAIGQGSADRDDPTPLSVFHPTYLVMTAGVADAFLTGDLFNLYVGFEVLLAASYVLLTLGGTRTRLRAGAGYVVVGLLSSLLFLTAAALVYAATGTLNLAQLAVRLDRVDAGVRLVLELMLVVAFGVKAAVFPLSAWLPDSYPTAPAPVTAVFAGLLTKVGVYAVIRTQTLLFPEGRLRALLLAAAALTMLVGILGALVQTETKRLLSFTLVSHIGYMVFGVAVATSGALGGAVFYTVHHILVQTTLFLVAALVERRAPGVGLGGPGGLAWAAPFLAALFFVPAMSLAGIPPLSGFLGKWLLLQAGVADGSWEVYALLAVSLVTSLLTLYTMGRVWNQVFWGPGGDRLERAPSGDHRTPPRVRTVRHMVRPATISGRAAEGGTIPPVMTVTTTAMVLLVVAVTVWAGPLVALCDRTGRELLGRGPYLHAVSVSSGAHR